MGADFETVRKNFRRLMRQYHPDVNGGDPARQKAANDRAATITAAYQELEQVLAGRR